MNLDKLNAQFGRDVTRCTRCGGCCNVGLSRCVEHRTDGGLAYDYGQQVYLQCPKCRDNNLFPWSSFLIVSDE
jgi:hypothetical protein